MYEKQADVLKHKKHLLETQRVRHNCRKSTKYSYRAAVTHIHNTASSTPTPDINWTEFGMQLGQTPAGAWYKLHCHMCFECRRVVFYMNTPTVFDWFSTELFKVRSSANNHTQGTEGAFVSLYRQASHSCSTFTSCKYIYIQQNTTYSSQGQTCLQRGNSHK